MCRKTKGQEIVEGKRKLKCRHSFYDYDSGCLTVLKALSTIVDVLVRHSMDRVGDAWHKYDAVVSKHVFSMLSRMGYAEARKPASPLTRGKPLIDSPTPMITLATAYLLIVILGTLFYRIKGPRKQKSDPLWLRVLVQVHNTFLVILSSYMSLTTAYCAWKYSYRFWGQGYSSSEKDMGWIIYVFFLSKIYEFMDTVSQQIHLEIAVTLQSHLSTIPFALAVHHVAERQNRTNHIFACLPPWYHFGHLVSSLSMHRPTVVRHAVT